MGGGESIIAIDICQSREARRKGGVIGFFACVEADVFDQDHFGGAGFFWKIFGSLQRLDERHRVPKRFFECGQHNTQAEIEHGFAFGAAKMRHEQGRSAFGKDRLDCGHNALDTGCV